MTDPETKHAAYGTTAYDASGAFMMSFKPINAIHQHLCAFHCYAQDTKRHVEAHHYCARITPDLHQCVIYDSDEPNARLIGIEYIVSEKMFEGLAEDERKYWHSHKYEVESGLLQLQVKGAVPGHATDLAEQPAMLELQKTYGKTIHTWATDVSPDLPLGPPNLMLSYTRDGQLDERVVQARDERLKMSTGEKRQFRQGYLPDYKVAEGADRLLAEGKGLEFCVKEKSM